MRTLVDSLVAQWRNCKIDKCKGCRRCKRAEQFCKNTRKEGIYYRQWLKP